MPRDEIERLVDGLAGYPGVAILSDEIYSRILYDDREHVSMLAFESIRDRLIILDGWSKTYAMTGWRVGYGVWPDSIVELAKRFAINDHSCVNAASQYAAIAALDGPQDCVEDMVRAFDERREVIVAALNALPGVRCVRPVGAFYAFANITATRYTSRELETRLLEEAGVATVSGTSFGSRGEGYLRFSYANSVPRIREAMDRIRTSLGN